MSPFDLIVTGLAGYRAALLLTQEGGPFDVFARFRRWARREPVGPGIIGPYRPFIGGVLSCLWCCSVWTTISAAILLSAPPTKVIAEVVAAMAIPVVLDTLGNRLAPRR